MQISEEEWGQQSCVDGTVDVVFEGNVAILSMKCGENRCNVSYVNKMNAALDKVEKNPNAECLITIGDGRFYGNGLDLSWLGMIGTTEDGNKRLLQFRDDYLQPLFERILTFPMPTIAALNGHCFAAGAVIALCHDYRIMNTEKGWFCLNEVHNGLRFNIMMYEILRSKLPAGQIFHDATVLGKRYTGREGSDAGIAVLSCSLSQLLPKALELAKSIPELNRDSLETMKKDMYFGVTRARTEAIGKSDINMGSIASNL